VAVNPKLRAKGSCEPPVAAGCPDHGAGENLTFSQIEPPGPVFANRRANRAPDSHLSAYRPRRPYQQPIEPRPVELPAGALSGEHAVPFVRCFATPCRNDRAAPYKRLGHERCPDVELTQQPLRHRRQNLARLRPFVPPRLQEHDAPLGRVAPAAYDSEINLLGRQRTMPPLLPGWCCRRGPNGV
jgi:hypothetical protein